MTNKPDSKTPAEKHPGMMGDGTEEQNLNQKGSPDARIKQDEVDAAFTRTRRRAELLRERPPASLFLLGEGAKRRRVKEQRIYSGSRILRSHSTQAALMANLVNGEFGPAVCSGAKKCASAGLRR
ncbi:MAG: hypothetical protein JWR49_3760 [Tardiphaga sp.]|nr:hypothetical protein [Tardiphaga sp.]